ncbi:uncharacterized protein LOC110849049 [Folsomia candida]|uniref:Uncharacterized protein n=1 Tax=Folsomia candida TaxID=158441 RepID=A0A226EEK3_FOLCA|nr:uncharacterized protein LOC110849049 [Folsomia candida]OXA56063.1 hypothetical protein Fcan01_09353 [Folsomia candida]
MYHFRTMRGGGAYVPPDTSTGLSWSQRPPELPRFTCGLAPQTLVKFFAAVDIAKNILGAVVFVYLYFKLRNADIEELKDEYSNNLDMQDYLNFPEWQQKGILFTFVLLFTLALIFSIILYRGARQANYSKLRIWFLYQLMSLITFSAVHIWMFIHGWLLPDRPRKLTGSLFLIFFMNYLWAGYSLYICYLLMVDISYFATSSVNNSRNGNLRMYQQQTEQFR